MVRGNNVLQGIRFHGVWFEGLRERGIKGLGLRVSSLGCFDPKLG
jgi:hypothetical protein